jgi:hypothetical protein
MTALKIMWRSTYKEHIHDNKSTNKHGVLQYRECCIHPSFALTSAKANAFTLLAARTQPRSGFRLLTRRPGALLGQPRGGGVAVKFVVAPPMADRLCRLTTAHASVEYQGITSRGLEFL